MNNTAIPHGLNCEIHGTVCPHLQTVKKIPMNKLNCPFAKSCKKNCEKEHCEEIVTRCNYLGITETLSEGKYALFARMKICGEHLDEKEKES